MTAWRQLGVNAGPAWHALAGDAGGEAGIAGRAALQNENRNERAHRQQTSPGQTAPEGLCPERNDIGLLRANAWPI